MCVCVCVCAVDRKRLDVNRLTNSVEFIWSTVTVAVGDTAVLHCSFDAIFQQLRSGNVRKSTCTTGVTVYSGCTVAQNVRFKIRHA